MRHLFVITSLTFLITIPCVAHGEDASRAQLNFNASVFNTVREVSVEVKQKISASIRDFVTRDSFTIIDPASDKQIRASLQSVDTIRNVSKNSQTKPGSERYFAKATLQGGTNRYTVEFSLDSNSGQYTVVAYSILSR